MGANNSAYRIVWVFFKVIVKHQRQFLKRKRMLLRKQPEKRVESVSTSYWTMSTVQKALGGLLHLG